jgi:hypothetical protein
MTKTEKELFRNGLALAQDYLDAGYERNPETREAVISMDTLGDLFDIAALTIGEKGENEDAKERT